MKSTDAQKQPTGSTARPQQPFFGPEPAQAFFAPRQTVQRQPFFKPSGTGPVVQAKLTVGAVGDKYEQEADRVATEVVDRINNPSVQSTDSSQPVQRMDDQEEELQMQRSTDATQVMRMEQTLRMKTIAESTQRINLSKLQRQLPTFGNVVRVPIIQRALENTSINSPTVLGLSRGAVETYANALSQAVEDARNIIATKYFVHVPSVDGYMQNLVDNFEVSSNKFQDGSAVPRQAGYWIESYATKIAAPTVGNGLNVLLQAKRGNSRPDVILQRSGIDIAWLDITSSASEGHIYEKNATGWNGTPYVTEVTYPQLKLTQLNAVAVPDKSSMDLSALLAAAEEAHQKQLNWEAAVLEKHGISFASRLRPVYNKVKEVEIRKEDEMDVEDWDATFSSREPENKYQTLALSLLDGKMNAHELAAVAMYWNGMIDRYEKRYGAKLPLEYRIPSKKQLGLEWVSNVSSADGEPVVRELFPI